MAGFGVHLGTGLTALGHRGERITMFGEHGGRGLFQNTITECSWKGRNTLR